MKTKHKINLTYFKQSGKYYASGEYYSEKEYAYEIFDEVEEMLEKGQRPGLVDGENEFFVHISSETHPLMYPHLLIPSK